MQSFVTSSSMASKTPQEFLDEKLKQNTTDQFEKFLHLEYRPFRENVRSFVAEFADKVQDFAVSGMSAWSTTLVTGEENHRLSIPMYTIEETLDNNSEKPFCDYCKFIGWGHHFVSQRKYHFIIPAFHYRGIPWDKIFAMETHILYGVVHCNGYGHLIHVGGPKGESKIPSKNELMNFRDYLCSALRTRKISVRDETNLRLLHGVVNGQSWYGRWGYEFSLGTFGVTEEKYKAAIEYLKSFDLGKIVKDSKEKAYGTEIRKIVNKWREETDEELKTLSDLLRFMMGVPINADALAKLLAENNIEKKEKTKKTAKAIAKKTEKLTVEIMLMLNHMMILLNESQGSDGGRPCIGRHKMHEEIKKCDGVGSTSLINFVLASITRFAIGNFVIRRLKNASTNNFEFKIEEVTVQDLVETDVFHDDIGFLCGHVLELYKDSLNAVREFHYSKNFVKDWKDGNHEKEKFQFMAIKWKCFTGLEKEFKKCLEHDEIVFVPPSMTIDELQEVVQTALRDTYCIMKNFRVTNFGPFNALDTGKLVCGTIDPGETVWVRGSELDLSTKLIYADGYKTLTVACTCGAIHDDGENFAVCKECKTRQHTRCRGLDDPMAATVHFLCSKCAGLDEKK